MSTITSNLDMTGATDSTTAFSIALTDAAFRDGVLVLPEGRLQISSVSLNEPTRGLTIRGAGKFATSIVTNSAAANVLSLTMACCEVRDLMITSSVPRTAGAHLVTGSNICNLYDVGFDGYYRGIAGGDNAGTWRDILWTNPALNGIGAVVNGFPVSLTIDNPTFYQGAYQALAGIQLVNAGGVMISRADIVGQGINLLVNPGNGQGVFSLQIDGGYYDSGITGILIDPSGNGNVCRVTIERAETNSNTANGMTIQNSGIGLVAGIEILGHMGSLNASGSGLAVIGAVTGLKINGGTWAANENGIDIGANVMDFSIVNAQAGAGGGMPGNSNYGLFVTNGTSDRYNISANSVGGNGVGGIYDGGTGINKFVGSASGPGANIV